MLISLSSYGVQLNHRHGLISAFEEVVSTVGKQEAHGIFDNERASANEQLIRSRKKAQSTNHASVCCPEIRSSDSGP